MPTDPLAGLFDHLVERAAQRAAEIVIERMAERDDTTSPWLTLPEAAEYLRTTPEGLRKQRDVPRHRHAGRLLYRREELDAYLDDHAEGPAFRRRER